MIDPANRIFGLPTYFIQSGVYFYYVKLFITIVMTTIFCVIPSLAQRNLSEEDLAVMEIIRQADQLNNPAEALTHLNAARQHDLHLEDSIAADLFFNLGIAHGKLYHIDSSKLFFNQALSLVAQTSFDLLEIGVLNGLGNIARMESNNELSMQYFQQALKKTQTKDEKVYNDWSAKLLGNLAGIYFDLEEFATALVYCQEALLLAKKAENNRNIAQIYNQLSYLYSELDSTYQGLEYSKQAAIYLKKSNDSLSLVYQYYSLGLGYFKIDDLAKSKENFLNAKKLAEVFNEAETYAGCLQRLGLIELQQSNIMIAKSYASAALRYSKKHQLLTHQKGAYNLLYQIAINERAYKKALSFRNEYYDLKDSIGNVEIQNRINELNAKYESEKKETEIATLNIENRLAQSELNEKRIFQAFLTVVIFMLLAVGVFVFFTQKQKSKLKQQAMLGEISEMRIEIKALLGKYEGQLDMNMDELNQKLVNPLSEREFDIFGQVFSQKSNQEIADVLFVSINTVKTHLKNIYSKLGVSNRKEALSIVLKNQT